MQDNSNYVAMLKEWYTDDRIAMMVLEKSPLLAMLTKKTIGGKWFDVPIVHGYTAGHSGSFAVAQQNKGHVVSSEFNITPGEQYALGSITRKIMKASENNRGAFLPAARVNIDSALKQLRRDLIIHLARDGSGARGQVQSYADAGATGVITLVLPGDAVNFSLNDVLKFSATKTGGGVEAGFAIVTAIDLAGGTITVAEQGGVSIDASDYIYCDGDKDNVLLGLQRWFPKTAATDTLHGLNRAVNPVVFGGVRSNAQNKTRYEALIDALSEVAALGDGSPTHAFMSPFDHAALVKEMEAQVTRPKDVYTNVPVRKGSEAMVGFSGIVVHGPNGDVQCYQDRFLEKNECYLLNMSECGICHYGNELVEIVGRDSDEGMLVESGLDGYEIRCVSYPEFYCNAPGHQGIVYNFGV